MRAEKAFARNIGMPITKPGKPMPSMMTQEVPPAIPVRPATTFAAPDETQCFRFLSFFGEIEQMPVPLLFGVGNLYLLRSRSLCTTQTEQRDVHWYLPTLLLSHNPAQG